MAGENGAGRWVVDVKRLLTEKIETKRAIPRLPRPMVDAKPEAYIPQILSLGPYHRRSLSDISLMEMHKIKSARDALDEAKSEQAKSDEAKSEQAKSDQAKSDEAKSEQAKSEQAKSDQAKSEQAESDQLMRKLYAIIEKNRKEFEKFYDWDINKNFLEFTGEGEDRSENFGWMIIVDALFLFKLLKVGFDHPAEHPAVHPPADPPAQPPAEPPANPPVDPPAHLPAKSLEDPPAIATVRCDIVKLENQIPLFVLRELERALRTNTSYEEKLDDYVRQRISTDLSCFQVYHGEEIKKVANEHHLLGCMHTYVSSFLEIQNGQNQSRQPTVYERISTSFGNGVACVAGVIWRHPVKDGKYDFMSRYNAEELVKAGIKIKSFKQVPGKITFNKHSQTLFLPRIIVIDTYTEVMLRNLLALEFYDANPVKHVTHYVELMDCLIDTPEDVRLLRDCGVIVRKSMMITDEYVADMWNGMCKPFFAALLEPPPQMKAEIKEVLIKNYYKTKIRTLYQEFHKEYLSSPWKAVALFVGIFVLLLDVTQTYCSFRECTPESRQSMESPTPTRKHFSAFGGV